MPNLNVWHGMGNLTRDPEVKHTPKGTAICDIGLAINRQWTNDSGQKMEEVTFVDVTFWGKTAEIIGEYFKKGRPIYVQGRLKLDTWDDKQTGQKKSKLRIVGESFQFLGGKKDDESGGDEPQERKPRTPPPRRQAPPKDPDLDQPEDDIPFKSILSIASILITCIRNAYAKAMLQMWPSQRPVGVL